jgi:membrane-bound ClpP family serine protease
MSEYLIIASLLVLGLLLLLVEVIFIPGTTVVGIVGGLLCIAGISYTYAYLGTTEGHLVAGSTLLVGTIVFWYGLKTDVWSRFALKQNITGKVGEDDPLPQPLQVGITISVLRPSGVVEVEGNRYEAHSLTGSMIESNQPIRVVKVENRKIFVELYNP